MKKVLSISLVVITSLTIIFSCSDIFETDLSGSSVEIIAPSDSLSTDVQTQRFWWNYVPGALWYDLQVVSPDFSNVSSVRLDTTIDGSNFQLFLQPGVYHWRVRALNGSSATDFNERSLTILPQSR